MSLNLIFHISDFHNLKIVNNIFFFILKVVVYFCPGVIKQFYFKQFSLTWGQFFFVYTQLNVKTVQFQTIQFSINTLFSTIWPMDRTLSGATTPDQNELGSDGNKGVLRIPQSSGITGNSPSDCLVSYQDTR